MMCGLVFGKLLAKIQQYNNAQALVDSVREGVKVRHELDANSQSHSHFLVLHSFFTFTRLFLTFVCFAFHLLCISLPVLHLSLSCLGARLPFLSLILGFLALVCKLQAQSRKTHVRLASVVGRFETQGEYHNNVESEAPSQTRPSSPPPAKRQRTHSSPGMQRDDSASSATSSKSSGILELILEPHPEAYDVPALERKFLATDLGCSVAHLDRYLQTQFSNLEPPPGKSR